MSPCRWWSLQSCSSGTIPVSAKSALATNCRSISAWRHKNSSSNHYWISDEHLNCALSRYLLIRRKHTVVKHNQHQLSSTNSSSTITRVSGRRSEHALEARRGVWNNMQEWRHNTTVLSLSPRQRTDPGVSLICLEFG